MGIINLNGGYKPSPEVQKLIDVSLQTAVFHMVDVDDWETQGPDSNGYASLMLVGQRDQLEDLTCHEYNNMDTPLPNINSEDLHNWLSQYSGRGIVAWDQKGNPIDYGLVFMDYVKEVSELHESRELEQVAIEASKHGTAIMTYLVGDHATANVYEGGELVKRVSTADYDNNKQNNGAIPGFLERIGLIGGNQGDKGLDPYFKAWK